jgi:hypothetical protein
MTFKGDLETINLPDVLQLLSSARKSGALSIRRNVEEKRLYFREGLLVYASSTDEREKLGSVLVRENYIDAAAVENVKLQQEKSGRPFGLCLLEQGKIPHDKLISGLKTQARMIITNLFQWWGGHFEFIEGNQAWPDEVSVGFDIQGIIMDAAAAVDEWNRIKGMVPDLDVVLEVVPAPVRGKGAVEFDDREWHVLSLLNGYRSVVDVAAASNLSDIETCSVVCRLLERGVIRPKAGAVKEDATPRGEPSGAEALLAIYNELFAQVFYAVSEEAGADALVELNNAAAARTGAAPFLAGSWVTAKGVLNREAVLRNFLAADLETRDEELAAALCDLFRYRTSSRSRRCF